MKNEKNVVFGVMGLGSKIGGGGGGRADVNEELKLLVKWK